MSPVELYWVSKFNGVDLVDDWDRVFAHSRNLVVVESQDEYDFIWAMQLVHGGEISIKFHDGSTMSQYRMSIQGKLYTTWDPTDRNRI